VPLRAPGAAAAIFISFMKSSNEEALPALTTPTGNNLAVLQREDRDLGVLAVALLVELDQAGGAVVLDLCNSGRYLAGSVESAFCIAAIISPTAS